jgi:hypothetical protein
VHERFELHFIELFENQLGKRRGNLPRPEVVDEPTGCEALRIAQYHIEADWADEPLPEVGGRQLIAEAAVPLDVQALEEWWASVEDLSLKSIAAIVAQEEVGDETGGSRILVASALLPVLVAWLKQEPAAC